MDERTRSMTTANIPNYSPSAEAKKEHQNHDRLEVRSESITNTEYLKKHKQITHLAIMLSVAYFIFWLPSVIYFILLRVCPSACFANSYKDSSAETYIGFSTKYLAFLDALIAPLIYCFYQEEFRQWLPRKKLDSPNINIRSQTSHMTDMNSMSFINVAYEP